MSLFRGFNEALWSIALSWNNLYFTPWIPLKVHVMSWLRASSCHKALAVSSQGEEAVTDRVCEDSFLHSLHSFLCSVLGATCISYLVYSINSAHWSSSGYPLRQWPVSRYQYRYGHRQTRRQTGRQEASVCRQIDRDWEGERQVVSNAGRQEGRRADGWQVSGIGPSPGPHL